MQHKCRLDITTLTHKYHTVNSTRIKLYHQNTSTTWSQGTLAIPENFIIIPSLFADTIICHYLYNCAKRHNNDNNTFLIMDIDTILNNDFESILKSIAHRVKERRLERNFTQKAFAKRSGVGYDAYRKFENTGDITLRNLVLCAVALDDTDGFTELFTKKSYQSIDDLLKTSEVKKRKRGTRNE